MRTDQIRKKRSGLWRIVRWLACGVAALLMLGGAGATWNALATHRDRASHPPPGHRYDVNGFAMHLYCTGTGSPTLVLESGRGEDFTVWGKVQPALSDVTRTCSYDRAGFGWSEPQPGERDAVHIAGQLHALLAHAGITAPVVLEGHSAGGLYARVYASTFPRDVAGLVLVDALTPVPLPEPAFSDAMDRHSDAQFAVVKATVGLGLARLMGRCATVPVGLEAYAGWIKAANCYYPALDAYVREDRALGESRKEGVSAGPFGDLPLLILSQDDKQAMPAFLQKHVSAEDWAWYLRAHGQDQAAYLALSTQSRRVIAAHSGHYIQYDRPDIVIRETAELIDRIRKKDLAGSVAR